MLHDMIEYVFALFQPIVAYLNVSRIQSFSALFNSFCIALLMVAIVLTIELFYVGWKDSGMRRLLKPNRSTMIDIVMFFLYATGAISILAVASSLGIPYAIKAFAYRTVGLNLGFELPILVHLAIFLVVLDFFNYWQHRILHRVPALWHIHAFHHAATEFNTVTVFREHPLDQALRSFVSLIPAILLGVPTVEFPIFISVYGIIGYIKHSKIPWRMGWFGKYVIQSPVDHWIHHSNQTEHYDTNFANVFAFWDHIFGTYYKGNKLNDRIGLDDAPLNRGVVRDMITSQWLFMKAAASKLWRRPKVFQTP